LFLANVHFLLAMVVDKPTPVINESFFAIGRSRA